LASAESRAPIATFALFAYNQEKFIREAVEGAFAQTYEPLEIILSDDCSADDTFAIMQEMAAAYRGPHRVRAVRTPHNLGLVQHVLLRGREAAGEVVVLAAGDDISLPERVSRHVPCYADAKVWAVTTGFHLMDESGSVVSENETMPVGFRGIRRFQTYIKKKIPVIQGATASYKKDTFSLINPADRIFFAEDNLFNFIIPASGYDIAFIPDPVVMYRRHDAAWANRPQEVSDWHDYEMRSARALEQEFEMLQFFLDFIRSNHLEEIVDVVTLLKNVAALNDLKAWPTLSVWERIASILRDLLNGRTYALPLKGIRLFGRFPDYWPTRLVITTLYKYRRYSEQKRRKAGANLVERGVR